MTLAIALVLAVVAQFALQSVHLPVVLATAQPVLLVVVASTRRFSPIGAGWLGLVAGLVSDVVADRIVGPGAVAGAIAGTVVGTVVRRFELEGPLFWIVGSLLAAACSEAAWALILLSMGGKGDHGWIGALAALATTGALGLAVAAGDRFIRAWRNPLRRRRRLVSR